MWAYATVFGSTIASLRVPDCDPSQAASAACVETYEVSIILFGIVVVGLALIDLGDQSVFQNALSIYRMLALGAMIVTAGLQIVDDGWVTTMDRARNKVGLGAKWANVGYAFGPTLLSINCQYNLPDTLQPLRDKRMAQHVAFGALLVAVILYLGLGLSGVLAFDDVHALATIQWRDYGDKADNSFPVLVWCRVLRLLILFCPVANVVSAYPLVGRTVAENALQAFPASRGSQRAVVIARLAATMPPILLAVVFKHLATVFSIAGLFGMLLGFSVPAALQLFSVRYCLNASLPTLTPYSTLRCLTSPRLTIHFLSFTLLATAIAAVTLFIADPGSTPSS